jgi:hypothetical protein
MPRGDSDAIKKATCRNTDCTWGKQTTKGVWGNQKNVMRFEEEVTRLKATGYFIYPFVNLAV